MINEIPYSELINYFYLLSYLFVFTVLNFRFIIILTTYERL